jgi:hypothetical protein
MVKAVDQLRNGSPRPLSFGSLLCVFSFLSLIFDLCSKSCLSCKPVLHSFSVEGSRLKKIREIRVIRGCFKTDPCESVVKNSCKFVANSDHFASNCGNFPAKSCNFLARFGKVWLGVFPDKNLNNRHFCLKNPHSPKSNTPSPSLWDSSPALLFSCSYSPSLGDRSPVHLLSCSFVMP